MVTNVTTTLLVTGAMRALDQKGLEHDAAAAIGFSQYQLGCSHIYDIYTPTTFCNIEHITLVYVLLMFSEIWCMSINKVFNYHTTALT